MAVAPNKLRHIVWLTLPGTLYFALQALKHFRDDALWNAAAYVIMGGLLTLMSVRSAQNVVANIRTWAIPACFGVIGMLGWLAGTDTVVRVAGFVAATGSMIVLMLLSQTPRTKPAISTDDQPVVLNLSK